MKHLETYTAAQWLELKFQIEMMINLVPNVLQFGTPLLLSRLPAWFSDSPCGLCTLTLSGYCLGWIISFFLNGTPSPGEAPRQTGKQEQRRWEEAWSMLTDFESSFNCPCVCTKALFKGKLELSERCATPLQRNTVLRFSTATFQVSEYEGVMQ